MSHKVLEALLKKARSAHKAAPTKDTEAAEGMRHLFLAILGSNAPRAGAEKAVDKLVKSFIDLNEIRVSLGDELLDAIGASYPQGRERVQRLMEAMGEVFMREHQMELVSLKGKGKREQREYLDTLPGLTGAMAAQVFALAFEGHAVPVDERLLTALKEAGALEDNCDATHAENIVTRSIKAGEAVETFYALWAWVDANPPKVWPPRPTPVPVFVAPPAPPKGSPAALAAAAANAALFPPRPAVPAAKPAVSGAKPTVSHKKK